MRERKSIKNYSEELARDLLGAFMIKKYKNYEIVDKPNIQTKIIRLWV